MGLFDKQLRTVREFVAARELAGQAVTLPGFTGPGWPSGGRTGVVMSRDTAVELGHPDRESVSFLLWSDDMREVRDGVVTLIGPDLPACGGMSIPFGKIVIAGVEGFNEDNAYDRYREMDDIKYRIDLRGYMMRAAPQYRREWSRVSRAALSGGFSLSVLGESIIERFRTLEYVRAVELVFVTSSTGDIRELAPVSDGAAMILWAMTRMVNEISLDCDACGYLPVCGEVSGLRTMRERLNQKSNLLKSDEI